VSGSDLCLSVDLGTGGPKIALVTLHGEVIAHEVHAVATDYSDDGGATQDAEQWWQLISDATRRLLTAPDVTKERVRAVAVTGQYASTVPVDANGLPTGPCLTWLDTRGRPYSKKAIGGAVQGYNARKALAFVRKTGGGPSPSGADPTGQMLFLMHEAPELMAKTRWMMEPVDYLTMRFTGVASATHASRLALWMTNNRELSTFSYDEKLLSMVGLESKYLPPLVPFGSIVGHVTTRVADELGLADETAVVTGIPDLHAAALGAGATKLYDTHLALSTTSWISCPLPAMKTDVKHTIATVPGLTNNTYLMINSQDTGASALQWFQGALAGAGSVMSFDEMTSLAATSPPGARGVVFSPWLAGERSPVGNRNIRAGFSNLSLTATSADLIRAVLEGVAANSAWLFGYVEKFTGQRLSPIRLLGGGAQSALWCQIYADTLGRDVEQVPEPLLAQSRGAALLAAVALGEARLDGLGQQTTGQMFEPSNHEQYRERASELAAIYQRDKTWSRRAAKKIAG
jgi:xylulokinase